MNLKYRSKSEFLGKKRLCLIRLSLLTNSLLSSQLCFVHVSLLSMVTPYSLELEDRFMRCWLILKLPKGLIKWFCLRIIPSHFLGCGTRELCLHQRASSSRALFSVVVTWSTDSPTQCTVVSTAYRNVVAVLTVFGRSLVYSAFLLFKQIYHHSSKDWKAQKESYLVIHAGQLLVLLQWGTKVLLRNFRKMAPFCIVDIPIPFPCLPQPLLPESMLYFGPSSLSFISDNIDLGGEGIYGI